MKNLKAFFQVHNRMTEVICGKDIIYTLVPINERDIPLINTVKRHQIIGYVLLKEYYGIYRFFSIEDKYKTPIENHWTSSIVEYYDDKKCWLLIKEHPCKISCIMTAIYNRQIFYTNNFDIYKSDTKNCLVAVVTEMDLD